MRGKRKKVCVCASGSERGRERGYLYEGRVGCQDVRGMCLKVFACQRVCVCACLRSLAEWSLPQTSAPIFAYSWINLHLPMQMYANIISEHFKNRNQHAKRHWAV